VHLHSARLRATRTGYVAWPDELSADSMAESFPLEDPRIANGSQGEANAAAREAGARRASRARHRPGRSHRALRAHLPGNEPGVTRCSRTAAPARLRGADTAYRSRRARERPRASAPSSRRMIESCARSASSVHGTSTTSPATRRSHVDGRRAGLGDRERAHRRDPAMASSSWVHGALGRVHVWAGATSLRPCSATGRSSPRRALRPARSWSTASAPCSTSRSSRAAWSTRWSTRTRFVRCAKP